MHMHAIFCRKRTWYLCILYEQTEIIHCSNANNVNEIYVFIGVSRHLCSFWKVLNNNNNNCNKNNDYNNKNNDDYSNINNNCNNNDM